jgi:hypothetical protein
VRDRRRQRRSAIEVGERPAGQVDQAARIGIGGNPQRGPGQAERWGRRGRVDLGGQLTGCGTEGDYRGAGGIVNGSLTSPEVSPRARTRAGVGPIQPESSLLGGLPAAQAKRFGDLRPTRAGSSRRIDQATLGGVQFAPESGDVSERG